MEQDEGELFAERRTPIGESRRRRAAAAGYSWRDLALGLVVLSLISAAAWYFVRLRYHADAPFGGLLDMPLPAARSQLEQAPLAAAAPQALEADSELAPVAQPARLDGSDAQVGAALQDLSPALLQWLTPKEQVRKWVSLVATMAEGEVVNKHRPLAYPMPPFATRGSGVRLTIDPANYRRSDPLLNAVLGIPPEKLAAYYRRWSPVLEQSFAELGREGTFHGRLLVVLDLIGEAPPAPESALLEQPHVLYQYVDPQLEATGDVHKLLWRLGSERMAQLREYVTQLKAAL